METVGAAVVCKGVNWLVGWLGLVGEAGLKLVSVHARGHVEGTKRGGVHV